MNVAIIPARGGSKRIPRKNIRLFAGKPMIHWPIEAARSNGLFDRIIVSTDDPEIRDIAVQAGAEAPFQRPAALSDSDLGTLPVIRHAIEWLVDHATVPVYVCCIYATAAFLRAEDLARGLIEFERDPALDFAFSVAQFSFPIQRALRIGADGRITMPWPEQELIRSQDLPVTYHDAGQFYWGTTEAWRCRDRIFSSRSRAVILDPRWVQDIDTEDDWRYAELKFQLFLRHGGK